MQHSSQRGAALIRRTCKLRSSFICGDAAHAHACASGMLEQPQAAACYVPVLGSLGCIQLTCVVQEGAKKPACILHASAAPCELRIQPAPSEAHSPDDVDDLYRRLGLVLNVEQGGDARLRIKVEAPAAHDGENQNEAARPQRYELDASKLKYSRAGGLSFELPSANLVRSMHRLLPALSRPSVSYINTTGSASSCRCTCCAQVPDDAIKRSCCAGWRSQGQRGVP